MGGCEVRNTTAGLSKTDVHVKNRPYLRYVNGMLSCAGAAMLKTAGILFFASGNDARRPTERPDEGMHRWRCLMAWHIP